MKTLIPHEKIKAVLNNCKELTAFCSQNGWIIDESIDYEILEYGRKSILIYVTFLESIMEGSGCQADQKPCYGRLRLELNESGDFSAVKIS